MIAKKGFNVLVAIVVIIASNVCTACFKENYESLSVKKTGETFFTECTCDTLGYTIEHIQWIDPQGRRVQPKSTNTVGKHNQITDSNTKEKQKLVEQIQDEDSLAALAGTEPNVYTEDSQSSVDLFINSISTETSGVYKCETVFEGIKYTRSYDVQVHDDLYFANTSTSQYVVFGEDSIINCMAKGNSNSLSYSWEVNDTSISENSKYVFDANGPLIVKNASKDDVGLYRCSVNEEGQTSLFEREITVEFSAKPVISELRATPAKVVLAGSNVTVECVAEGTPHPEYFWSKTTDWLGHEIKASVEQNVTWRQEINTIVFDEIEEEDAGVYECTAANPVGSYQRTIKIEVQVAPNITDFEDVIANEGSTVQIRCTATGNPAPLITVTYDGDEYFQNDSRIQPPQTNPTENGTELYVIFHNVTKEFGGIYFCQASNAVDNVTKAINFTVFYPPYFEEPEETIWGWNEKTINMNCEYESNPPANRTWTFQANDIGLTSTAEHVEMNRFLLGQLNNNQGNTMSITINKKMRYGVYECLAKNELGIAKKIVYLKEAHPPGAIMNVTLLNITASSMTFNISGPEYTEGPPVIGYEAQYDTSDNFNVTNIHINRTWGLDRKFIVERLKPKTTYTFKFAAKNEAGVGVWTEIMEFETPETSVPEPPTWDDSQYGILRWKLPEANGNPIDHYIIEYCPFYDQVVNYSLCKEENLTATEFRLDGLDRSTTYIFKLRAHNLHGLSDFAEKEVIIPEKLVAASGLSAGAIIGLSIVVVFLMLLLMDLMFLCWRRQGIIASCYFKKNKKKEENLQSRDKKGLLVKEGEPRPDDSLTRPNNGHKEFEYNKTTGVITGKHSTV